MKKILIRGKPGIGKTSVIKKLLPKLEEKIENIVGFYTEEKREFNKRTGFDIVEINGERIPLARIDSPKRTKIGRYGVFVENIDIVSERFLKRVRYCKHKSTIFIVDEFGKMEFLSLRFVELTKEIFTKDCNLIGTIPVYPIKYLQPFLTSDIHLLEINQYNRDLIPAEILKLS